jgi:hypothetical protein
MQRQKRGRPTKRPSEGERVSLGLRVTPAIKELLDKAAADNGRSQSQEAELRLERSFERQAILGEALELAYGSEAAGILLAVIVAMTETGKIANFDRSQPKYWVNDPSGYNSARIAADLILRRLEPIERGVKPSLDMGPSLVCVSNLTKALKGQAVDEWARTLFPWRQIEASRSLLREITDRIRDTEGGV